MFFLLCNIHNYTNTTHNRTRIQPYEQYGRRKHTPACSVCAITARIKSYTENNNTQYMVKFYQKHDLHSTAPPHHGNE